VSLFVTLSQSQTSTHMHVLVMHREMKARVPISDAGSCPFTSGKFATTHELLVILLLLPYYYYVHVNE